MLVTTYQTTASQYLRICRECERKLREADLWPRTAHGHFRGVYYSLHRGSCDTHRVIDAAIAGEAVIKPYIALT